MNLTITKPISEQLEVYKFDCEGIPEAKKLPRIAKLYANAFAGAPWNEYKVCPNNHYFGLKQAELTNCTDCNQDLKLAYPEKETADYIAREVGKQNGNLITFEDKTGEVFAAGWGYACTIEELKAKYNSTEMKEKVSDKITNAADKAQRVFYISEIMVDIALRQQGKATEITQNLLDKARTLNLVAVMRTRRDSPMVRIADKMQMSQVLAPGEDTDNPNRVLYIKI